MTRRNLVHISREPMQLSDVTIQPVLFTALFVYIFGGAIPIPGGGSYKDYLLAGILALNLVTSTMGTAVGLSTDLHEGMIDRFRALPMWRSAVLVGRSVADLMTSCLCALIVALTGLAVGWRADASAASVLAGFLIVLFFAYSLAWVAGVRGPQLQEPGVGGFVRLHRAVPAGLRLERHGAHSAYARVVAGHRQLEPGERRVRGGPPPLGEPEPLGDGARLADAASHRSFVDLVSGHPGGGRFAGGTFLPAADYGIGNGYRHWHG